MALSSKGRSPTSPATSRVFVSTGLGGTVGVGETPCLAFAIGEGVGSVPPFVETTGHRQSKMMKKKQQETLTTITLWAVLPWVHNSCSSLLGYPFRDCCYQDPTVGSLRGAVSGTEEP